MGIDSLVRPGVGRKIGRGEELCFVEDSGDFEVVPAGTMRKLVELAESSIDPALKAKLLEAIPKVHGGNG